MVTLPAVGRLRRRGAVGIVLAVVAAPVLAAAGAQATDSWAESVALVGVAADGDEEIGLRLARFPASGTATLWVSVVVEGRRWGYAVDGLDLGPDQGRTMVADEAVSFEVPGSSSARFERRRRDGNMDGRVSALALAHESLHPPPTPGAASVSVEAEFRGRHDGVRVRPGRWEVVANAGRSRCDSTTADPLAAWLSCCARLPSRSRAAADPARRYG